MCFRKLRKNNIHSDGPAPGFAKRRIPYLPSDRWLRLNVCVLSDVGRVRPVNEDNYLLDGGCNTDTAAHTAASAVIRAPSCLGVFDGMGGGEAGEVASRLAAECLRDAAGRLDGGFSTRQIDEVIRRGFYEANAAIVDRQKSVAMLGTTGTVVVIFGRYAKVYHLGDSRLYLLRSGELRQITRDQTVARMKIDAGIYAEDDERVFAESHQLIDFIGSDGTKEQVRPAESGWFRVLDNDALLLCSDGLYDMCADGEIADILNGETEPARAVERLVARALENGGVDNVTCLLARPVGP